MIADSNDSETNPNNSDDNENEEYESFLSTSSTPHNFLNMVSSHSKGFIVIFSSILLLGLMEKSGRLGLWNEPSGSDHFVRKVNSVTTNNKIIPSYACPSSLNHFHAENDINEYFSDYLEYDDESDGNQNKSSISSIVVDDDFRNKGYDGYDESFLTHKERSVTYKSQVFGEALKSGDSIYESACGTGLNLIMTLEILEECCNVTDLEVYGNDYLEESVEIASRRLRREGWDAESICWGDSSDLNYVPSDVFDLAFTGYIDPLTDGLKLLPDNATFDDHWDIDNSICEGSDEDLQNKMQRKQEDWFASWVSELVRIARPGGTVVAEEIALPFCQWRFDWGGVEKDWWAGAVELYDWDVDVESIQFFNSTKNPASGRYNVVMKKN